MKRKSQNTKKTGYPKTDPNLENLDQNMKNISEKLKKTDQNFQKIDQNMNKVDHSSNNDSKRTTRSKSANIRNGTITNITNVSFNIISNYTQL